MHAYAFSPPNLVEQQWTKERRRRKKEKQYSLLFFSCLKQARKKKESNLSLRWSKRLLIGKKVMVVERENHFEEKYTSGSVSVMKSPLGWAHQKSCLLLFVLLYFLFKVIWIIFFPIVSFFFLSHSLLFVLQQKVQVK